MVTIQDIAKRAGVAKSTVSRYLNGGSVSEQTAILLKKIIEEENYTPSPFARSLKAKHTNIIGVIIPRLNSAATAHTLQGIEQEAQQRGYKLLIANTNQQVEQELAAIYQFAKDKVAGIVLLATEITPDHIQAFNEVMVPHIVVGQQNDELYCVVHDDYDAGKKLAEKMVALGHQHVMYVGVSPKDKAVGITRRDGVLETLARYTQVSVHVEESTFSSKDAVAKGEQLFKNMEDTIVIAATDNMAVGLLKAAHNCGVKIPEDVSIAGFGGYEIGEFVHPSLSTVKYQFTKAGVLAMELLTKRMKGKKCAKCTLVPTKIMMRESTKEVEV